MLVALSEAHLNQCDGATNKVILVSANSHEKKNPSLPSYRVITLEKSPKWGSRHVFFTHIQYTPHTSILKATFLVRWQIADTHVTE